MGFPLLYQDGRRWPGLSKGTLVVPYQKKKQTPRRCQEVHVHLTQTQQENIFISLKETLFLKTNLQFLGKQLRSCNSWNRWCIYVFTVESVMMLLQEVEQDCVNV